MTDSATWRKSSYSGGSGGDCVEVASWRKSSYSGGSGGNGAGTKALNASPTVETVT